LSLRADARAGPPTRLVPTVSMFLNLLTGFLAPVAALIIWLL
jgi:hypothetical protein